MNGLKSIILMGPLAVGKTTLACHLGYKYGLEILTCDELVYEFMKNQGIPRTYFQTVVKEYGIDRAMREYEDVCVKFITKLLQEVEQKEKMVIVDFGGNQTLFRNNNNFEMVNNEMQKFDNTILLIPDYDEEWSINFLIKRTIAPKYEDQNRAILYSDCNKKLAKHLLYTKTMRDDEVFNQVDYLLRKTNNMDVLLNEKTYHRSMKS